MSGFITPRPLARLSALLRAGLLLGLCGAASSALGAPVLLSEPDSTRAIALESPTFRRGPFAPRTPMPFHPDGRARLMLFAINLNLLPGESANALRADAEDGAHRLYSLTVEYAGKVPGQEWMHAVVVRLPEELGEVGDVLVRVSHHGVGSNRVRVALGHAGGGPPDDEGSAPTPAPPVPPAPTPTPTPKAYGPNETTEADAARLLEQATWGPTTFGLAAPETARVRAMGLRAYLEEQFNAPVSGYPDLTPAEQQIDHLDQLQVRFYFNALRGEDQLRQRVAFALNQLFVVSAVHDDLRRAGQMNPYLQTLTRHAFGNFRDIMRDVTLSPAMGRYQDHVNNVKADPAYGVEPNENYAREFLQLFTVGTSLLNEDGTPKLDAEGRAAPTYTQETVESFARVLTGWTYAPLPGAAPQAHNPPNFNAPMVVGSESNHDAGAKTLLAYPGARSPVLPAGQTAQKDLEDALDNVFHHPNVGPFVARYLIQNLVTSNPSPAYVARAAAAFDNDCAGLYPAPGCTGARGQLKATLRAILLDPEARGDAKTDPAYGKLREPAQFYVNVVRAFTNDYGTNDLRIVKDNVGHMGQLVFYSPTVFNFYRPDFQLPGTSMRGPEYEVLDSRTSVARANFASQFAVRVGRLAHWAALASDPPKLVDALDRILLHGTMSAGLRRRVLEAVSKTDRKVQTAVLLVVASPEYQVQR
jgi:uncharacterized protein (DUF1800 family)